MRRKPLYRINSPMITDRRLKMGLTIEQLAERAEVSINTAMDALHGSRETQFSTIRKLAKVLSLDPQDLIIVLPEGKRKAIAV